MFSGLRSYPCLSFALRQKNSIQGTYFKEQWLLTELTCAPCQVHPRMFPVKHTPEIFLLRAPQGVSCRVHPRVFPVECTPVCSLLSASQSAPCRAHPRMLPVECTPECSLSSAPQSAPCRVHPRAFPVERPPPGRSLHVHPFQTGHLGSIGSAGRVLAISLQLDPLR